MGARTKEPFYCQELQVVYDRYQELKVEHEKQIKEMEAINKKLEEYVENKEKYEICNIERAAYNATLEEIADQKEFKVQQSQTKMIGLGFGCTVLGLILGFLAFRYYKQSTNDANYNDDDDDDDENHGDLERGDGNCETIFLENNQSETETKQ